jgi:hypothetical protein
MVRFARKWWRIQSQLELFADLKDKVAIQVINGWHDWYLVQSQWGEVMIYRDIYWGTESPKVPKNLKDNRLPFPAIITRRVIIYS